MKHIDSLEECTITPSEIYSSVFEEGDTKVFKMSPPPEFFPIAPYTMDEDQKYKRSSPAEMRRYKSYALRIEEKKARKERVGESD